MDASSASKDGQISSLLNKAREGGRAQEVYSLLDPVQPQVKLSVKRVQERHHVHLTKVLSWMDSLTRTTVSKHSTKRLTDH